MHISGAFSDVQKRDIKSSKPDIKSSKPNIETTKPNIQDEKPNIGKERIAAYADKNSHVADKTIRNMKRLFEKFGCGTVFGRREVMETLDIRPTAASELLKRMLDAGIIEAVSGLGKGKYRF